MEMYSEMNLNPWSWLFLLISKEYKMNYRNKKKFLLNKKIITWLFLIFPNLLLAQSVNSDSTLQSATLHNCIEYAIQHNPDLQNAKINESITETIIKSKLADWYPQVNFTYNLQHNFQLPTFNFNGNLAHSGTNNTSGLNFGVTQNIFSRDVLLASRSANDVRLSASENTTNQKINLAVAVSKAFYNLILTVQQLKVVEQDIVRNTQSYKDALYQYQSGIVDKTDYQRALIALNNSKAQKVSTDQSLKAENAFLQELMGYPASQKIDLVYDTTQMEKEIYIDTLQTVNYANRIEIQQLETQKKLQQYNLQYYKWSFLPDLSAFGNYNLNYLNNNFSKLYNAHYPNSFLGITLTLPIFQGGKRLQQIKEAQFQITQADNNIKSQTNTINTQYQNALASYKSNLNNFFTLKENLSLASDVYNIIQLQYRSGVKAFLDVITAESDLRTAQINYYDALYQVLSSKIDVEQALGTVRY
ncbi:MAG TPA: TolC family protein [Hanamia sp.]|nr:TolC family protein [Hanamia sp.]